MHSIVETPPSSLLSTLRAAVRAPLESALAGREIDADAALVLLQATAADEVAALLAACEEAGLKQAQRRFRSLGD